MSHAETPPPPAEAEHLLELGELYTEAELAADRRDRRIEYLLDRALATFTVPNPPLFICPAL